MSHHQTSIAGGTGKRLATIIGHLQGVKKMADEGRYCIEIIKQLEAVEGAIAKTKEVILAGHLDGCVKDALKGKDERTMRKVMKELMEVFKAGRQTSQPRLTRTENA